MPTASACAAKRLDARVIARHGQHYRVRTDGGSILTCRARPRLDTIVCGDRVRVATSSASEGIIEAIHPRSSLIYRCDRKREKAIAANVSQAIVVLASMPRANSELIDRCVAAAEHAAVKILLVQNKIDLDPGRSLQASLLASYSALGYRVCELCAHRDVEKLRPELSGETSLMIGASGVGKSTIVNALLPDAQARTGEVSRTQAGRHTTTHAQLYRIDASAELIDSPGMHQFGLQHIAPANLAACFVEFRPLLGECRFNDCRHADEPGCALHEAVRQGRIERSRMHSYTRILGSLLPARSAAGRAEPARHRHQEDDEEP
jgi:ribosome biogenesis GTPase / thiamine phosphate phosphatase